MKRLDGGVGVRFLSLECHVGISDLRDSGEEEDSSEEKAEASNSKVNPLHVLQGLLVLAHAYKDGVRSEYWCHNCADAIECLGDVDPELRVTRRTADGDVWVRGGLEGSETITDLQTDR